MEKKMHVEKVFTVFPYGASQTPQMGSFPQIYVTKFLLHEREKKTCFCLSSNSRCQTTLGPRQRNFTSQGQKLAYPLKQMCASKETLQQAVQGPPCPKGHCVWALKNNPTTQPQHRSAPKPSRMGQGEAGHPSH